MHNILSHIGATKVGINKSRIVFKNIYAFRNLKAVFQRTLGVTRISNPITN